MQSAQTITARRWIHIQVLIWVAFVILLYYIHDQNWLENFSRDLPAVAESLWIHAVSRILWVAGFFILGYGVGRTVLDILKISSSLENLTDDILFSTAVGWGLIAIGAFVLGILGLLNWILHLALGVLLTGLAWKPIFTIARRLVRSVNDRLNGTSKLSGIEILLVLVITAIGLWGLGVNFAPEYSADGLNTLATSMTYIEEGQITFHPELSLNSLPQTVQMWFMESLMLMPEGAGPLLMGICRLLAALAIFAFVRRFFGRGPALASTLIYLLTNEVYRYATMSTMHEGLNLMLVLSIYAAFIYMEKPSRNVAILMGLMFGFAMGTHYAAIPFVILTAFTLKLYDLIIHRDIRRMSGDLIIGAIAMIAVSFPWYFRNIILFHNPIFPFASSFLPTASGQYADIASDLAVSWFGMNRDLYYETHQSILGFILLPFTFVFSYFNAADSGTAGISGPWALIVLPLAILLRKIPRLLIAAAGLTVLISAWWWFVEGVFAPGLMLPVYALIAIMAGVVLWNVLGLERVKITGMPGWIAAGLAFAIFVSYFSGVVPPFDIRGKMPLLETSRKTFTRRFFPASPVVEELNEMFREEGIIEHTDVYGFDAEQYRWFADFHLVGSRFGYADYSLYLSHAKSAEELHRWLLDYGIDFVFINPAHISGLPEEAIIDAIPRRLDNWQIYFERIPNESDLHVYRLK